MESLCDVLNRMNEAGYRDQFRASDDDRLEARDAGLAYAPESLIVDEVARFEGMSNPDDQSIVFALRAAEDRVLGTYTVAFGPDMDLADAKIVPRLQQTPGGPSRTSHRADVGEAASGANDSLP